MPILSKYFILCSVRSNLSDLVPRLWPFLYHSSSSVRCSTLKTLETLVSSANSADVSRMTVVAADVQNVSGEGTNAEQTEAQDIKTEAKLVVSDSADVKSVKTESENESKESTTVKTESGEVVKEDLNLPEVEKEVNESAIGDCSNEASDVPPKSPAVEKNESPAAEKNESPVTKQSCEEPAVVSVVSNCGTEQTPDNSSQSADAEPKCKSTVDAPCGWIRPIIQPALTHIYQRALLEQARENLALVFKVRLKLT